LPTDDVADAPEIYLRGTKPETREFATSLGEFGLDLEPLPTRGAPEQVEFFA
jgi:hypothetical protein